MFSASSEKARSLGNSIRYKEMEDVYEELKNQKVYINKKMNENYPLMAQAIYEGGEIQMILMLWGLGWEKMTLGQANFLTVVSYLIQNAVLRARRYMTALEETRYMRESGILEQNAFQSLVESYRDAKLRNLVEYTLLRVQNAGDNLDEIGSKMNKCLRTNDYMGILSDGHIYVLLANTKHENAFVVQDRFAQNGYQAVIVEKMSI